MITPTYKLLLVPLPATGLRLHLLCRAILPHLSGKKKRKKKSVLREINEVSTHQRKNRQNASTTFLLRQTQSNSCKQPLMEAQGKTIAHQGLSSSQGATWFRASSAMHLRPWTQFNFSPMSKCLLYTPTLSATFTAVCNVSTRDNRHGRWRGEFVSLEQV